MIKNIVFDMGQVLMYFDPDSYIARLGYTGEDAALLKREVFRSADWVSTDHGTKLPAEAAEDMCRRLPERLHAAAEELCCRWWHGEIMPVPGMAELVRELRAKGYGIYLLSNASSDLHKYFHRIPGSECFMGKLVSADVKLLKPMYEIYQRLYSDFGLKPEECWFVDDSPTNVECARCTGMGGSVFYNDAKRFRRELIEQGLDLTEE